METSLLIQIFIFLVILLAVLIFFLFRLSVQKRETVYKTENKEEKLSFTVLRSRLRDKQLGSKKLKETLDLIIKDYGAIKDINIYVDIILKVASHPSTKKDIIITFEKELIALNPKYKGAISTALTDGLNMRLK